MQLQTAEFPSGACGLSIVEVIRSDYWPNAVIAYENNHSLVERTSESQCKYEREQKQYDKTAWSSSENLD